MGLLPNGPGVHSWVVPQSLLGHGIDPGLHQLLTMLVCRSGTETLVGGRTGRARRGSAELRVQMQHYRSQRAASETDVGADAISVVVVVAAAREAVSVVIE